MADPKNKKKIFAVDDEKDILELISEHLSGAGFSCETFTGGEAFLERLKEILPRLVILDIMLPDIDGLELCRRIRADSRTKRLPVIMLTAKDEELDKVLGLELGADDYMTKPFSPRELIARINAVLRRHNGHDTGGIAAKTKTNEKGICLDSKRYKLYIDGEEGMITVTQYKILSQLASNPGWVFSRQQILSDLWGDDRFSIERTVDVHIRHLRIVLGPYADYIENVRGIGYRINEHAPLLRI